MAGSMTEDGNRETIVLDGRQAAAVVVRGTPGSGPAEPTAMVKPMERRCVAACCRAEDLIMAGVPARDPQSVTVENFETADAEALILE